MAHHFAVSWSWRQTGGVTFFGSAPRSKSIARPRFPTLASRNLLCRSDEGPPRRRKGNAENRAPVVVGMATCDFWPHKLRNEPNLSVDEMTSYESGGRRQECRFCGREIRARRDRGEKSRRHRVALTDLVSGKSFRCDFCCCFCGSRVPFRIAPQAEEIHPCRHASP